MSDYIFKGCKLVTNDDKRECLCTVSVMQYRTPLEGLPSNCMLVNDDIISVGSLEVAKKILNGIIDNPEMYGPDNMIFKYLFPRLGDVGVILRFSGANMDQAAYETLEYGLASILLGVYKIALNKLDITQDAKEKAIAIINHMRLVLQALEAENLNYVVEDE